MPAFTIISNAMAIVKSSAKPILVDVDIDTWNIKIEDIEKKITKKTKCLMIPHIYGLSNDMDKINGETCCPGSQYWQKYDAKRPESKNYNVPLIENNEIIERPVDQTTITKRFSNKAVEFIKNNREDSFFIYLAHNLPHTPLYASDEFLGKSKRGLYGDVIEEIDHGVGLIIK